MVKPGVGTDEVAAVWPEATEFGFDNEMAAFGLQFGHGLGLGLHERPIISRLNSMTEPVELQVGMVFALETYCPASDGFSAARIEEEVVVTEDGPRILTLVPGPGARRRQPLLTLGLSQWAHFSLDQISDLPLDLLHRWQGGAGLRRRPVRRVRPGHRGVDRLGRRRHGRGRDGRGRRGRRAAAGRGRRRRRASAPRSCAGPSS